MFTENAFFIKVPGLIKDLAKCIKENYGRRRMQQNSTRKERNNFCLQKLVDELENENFPCLRPRTSSGIISFSIQNENIQEKVGPLIFSI